MSWMSKLLLAAAAAAVVLSVSSPAPANTIVKVQYNLSVGSLNSVFLELYDATQPATTANFLNYVNREDYNGVIMHRLVPGFVLQGGGFDTALNPIPTDPPVVNEPGRSNLRGTIAMAKLGGDPNSATDQFFFNLANNSTNLDYQNGGFTVFARVLGNGMDLIDAFASLTTINLGGAFTNVPVLVDPVQGNIPVVMTNVGVVQLRIGDTDLDGAVSQADADLLATTLVGGTDQPQFDVDANGTVNQADLDLLNALILGDIDGDGFVGIADLNVVLGNWNQNVPPGDPLADPSGDGFVGIDDLNAVLAAWNAGSPPPPATGATLPEPASLALLGLGAAMVFSRRRG